MLTANGQAAEQFHGLVSDEWEVVNAFVPSTRTLSDHRPLVARLRWKAAPAEE